jgi:enamine deaminase RidA (YjgF/YER057c/UK114 family)
MRRASVSCRTFTGGTGRAEHYISVSAPADGGFADQLGAVEDAYSAALRSLRLAPRSGVFRRIFLSDPANQAARLCASPLAVDPRGGAAAVSVVGQRPLPGGRLALLACHIGGVFAAERISPRHVLVKNGGIGHIWSAGLGGPAGGASTAAGTRCAFRELSGVLRQRGGSLEASCLRTWLFLRDVDLDYGAMVGARRALFARAGLTAATHYIASTGIGAPGAAPDRALSMDAYSAVGLRPGQVSYLNDTSRLCYAKRYRVTFERGTRIVYSDRAHLLISGTASIDGEGRIVHPGDALRQAERAAGNVSALLRAGGAKLKDTQCLTAYLRDPADQPRVQAFLKSEFKGVPICVVLGPVCRPGWLVEIECSAAVPAREPAFPAFL